MSSVRPGATHSLPCIQGNAKWPLFFSSELNCRCIKMISCDVSLFRGFPSTSDSHTHGGHTLKNCSVGWQGLEWWWWGLLLFSLAEMTGEGAVCPFFGLQVNCFRDRFLHIFFRNFYLKIYL